MGKSVSRSESFFARFQHLLRATPEQFGLGAVLLHSNTPSLRVAGIEDDDEDEYEATCERWSDFLRLSRPRILLKNVRRQIPPDSAEPTTGSVGAKALAPSFPFATSD